jgi:hypothetical protein
MDSLTTKTATAQTDFLNEFLGEGNKDEFQILNEEMSYAEYIQRVQENPRWERSAHQRVYDMIMDAGSKTFVKYRTTTARKRSSVSTRRSTNSSSISGGRQDTSGLRSVSFSSTVRSALPRARSAAP